MVFAVRVRPESTDRSATPGSRRRPWVLAVVLATTVLISGLIAPLSAEAAGTRSISGTVVGADAPSVGLEGADVQLTLPGGTYIADTQTAADGSYSFSGLLIASYAVSVQLYASEYVPATSAPVALGAGQAVTGINFALPVGGAIAGSVTGDGGAPVSGAFVSVSGTAGSGGGAQTAADGSYRVAGLAAGVFTVSVGVPSIGSALISNSVSNVSVALGSTTTTSIHLEHGASISGVVTSPAASPVSNVSVAAVTASGSAAATSTGANGSYTISGLVAGSYTLEFSTPFSGTYATQWWSGVPSQASAQYFAVGEGVSLTGYNAALAVGASISGTVTDPASAPLANVTVEGRLPGQLFPTATTFTDSAGHYSLLGLATGDYVVSFDPQGAGDEAAQWWSGSATAAGATAVHVGATENRTGVDAHLTAGGDIAGKISGAAATGTLFPAGNANLFIYRADGTLLTSAYTANLLGSYRIPNIPPGKYTLKVDPQPDTTDFASRWYANGSSQATATPITVTAGATTNIDVTLPSTTASPTQIADTSYVKALYQDFLDRTPNASEIGFWTDALSIGLPRTSIAAGFVTSDEYRLIRIDDAYQSVLGRASDAQGRQWWLAAVKAGSLQIDDVAEHFYSSQEYVDAHQGNGESNVTRNWIHQLYTDLLHRAPDASGLNFWEAATIANGRQSVVDGLWDSQETAGARVSAMYASYLGRTPDPDGLVFWTHVDLTLGDSVTRSSITASDEYYNLAGTRYPAS